MRLQLAAIVLLAILLFAGCTGQNKTTQENPPTAQPLNTFQCPDGRVVMYIKDCQPTKTYYCPDGEIVTDISKCKPIEKIKTFECPNGVLVNSSECKTENTSAAINVEPTQNISITINNTPTHLENESKFFIKQVNDKRTEFALFKQEAALKSDYRLNFIARKCNEEMLKNSLADLNSCYAQYGSFRNLLAKFDFYGNSFFYVSETNASSVNITTGLFDNLTESEKTMLIKESVDDLLVNYPFSVGYIGNSVDCNQDKCLQTTITAGNRHISRLSFINGGQTFTFNMFKDEEDSSFVNRKFTVKPAKISENYQPYCSIIFYENITSREAVSNFWWSDTYGGLGGAKHLYSKKISWNDYISEKIDTTTIAFVWCWSDWGGGTIEVTEEYLPIDKKYTDQDMQERLSTIINSVASSEKNATNILDIINRKRQKNGLPPLKESLSLTFLAQNLVDSSIQKNRFILKESEFNNTFGNSTYNIIYTLATKNIFGESIYSYNQLENIKSPYNLLDTQSRGVDDAFLFGNDSDNLEYLGVGYGCKDDVCISMIIAGSNTLKFSLSNTNKDQLYGLFILRYLKMNNVIFDYDNYPQIQIEVNSSVKANHFVYRGKVDVGGMWKEVSENYYQPQDGWELKRYDEFYINETLDKFNYALVYQPTFRNYNDYGNVTMTIKFLPKNPPE